MTTLPPQLTERARWVVWKAERGTKVPYNAKTGAHADSTDPSTWTDYATATAAATTGAYAGIGIVLGDGMFGIDLDDCISDDAVRPWAERIIVDCGTYAEVSPSGTGVKLFGFGGLPRNLKPRKEKIPAAVIPVDDPGKIEMYDHSRFFTVTGWHVDGTPLEVRPVNGALERLVVQLAPPEPAPVSHATRPAGRKYLERWAQYKIDYAVDQVRDAGEGTKHNTRYAMARLLGGLVPHGLATEDSLARALFEANPPKTEAQRSEYKTIVDGIHDGARIPLTLPPEPEQPIYDEAGAACCPKHKRILDAARNGNGWKCRARDSSTDSGWCDFWWDGDGYLPPKQVDPETGEVIEAGASDILLNAHRSDAGNAACFAAVHADELRYCHTRRKWLAWDGSRWAVDEGESQAHYAMLEVIHQRLRATEAIGDFDQRKKAAMWCIGCESTNKIEAALKAARRHSAIRTMIDDYDAEPLIAAAIGDTLDLRAVIHRAVRREDFLTMRLGTSYDPEADCPRWRQFLDEVFGGDAEVISYIQRAVGYCLTGDTREQKLFLCYGSGANGKSVFLETLARLLGDYAGNASFETFDANKRSESTNDLAALRGKRLVTVIETEEGRRLAEARVKSVTGQDLITCRFLYGEYFSYRPTYKIWLAMNHLPAIRGTDKGIWRRIQLIPFKQDFSSREDKTLAETLRGELPGILQWALEGLRAWWQRGLDAPMAVISATASYRAESDQIGRWINERCLTVSGVSMLSATGYKDYTAWCDGSGETAVSQNKWSRTINEKGFTVLSNTSARGWSGIGLRQDADS